MLSGDVGIVGEEGRVLEEEEDSPRNKRGL
jgi:hypothetical protein